VIVDGNPEDNHEENETNRHHPVDRSDCPFCRTSVAFLDSSEPSIFAQGAKVARVPVSSRGWPLLHHRTGSIQDASSRTLRRKDRTSRQVCRCMLQPPQPILARFHHRVDASESC
jgi:hypothetical protein